MTWWRSGGGEVKHVRQTVLGYVRDWLTTVGVVTVWSLASADSRNENICLHSYSIVYTKHVHICNEEGHEMIETKIYWTKNKYIHVLSRPK